MDYETFEKTVSSRAGMSRDRARVLIQATLETLGRAADPRRGGRSRFAAPQADQGVAEHRATRS